MRGGDATSSPGFGTDHRYDDAFTRMGDARVAAEAALAALVEGCGTTDPDLDCDTCGAVWYGH